MLMSCVMSSPREDEATLSASTASISVMATCRWATLKYGHVTSQRHLCRRPVMSPQLTATSSRLISGETYAKPARMSPQSGGNEARLTFIHLALLHISVSLML